jgi:hypothetical protein
MQIVACRDRIACLGEEVEAGLVALAETKKAGSW